jgi:hypothetical protein
MVTWYGKMQIPSAARNPLDSIRRSDILCAMISVDFVRSTLMHFMKQGMSPLEAVNQFSKADLNEALNREIKDGGTTLLDIVANAGREERNDNDMNKAIELWLNGWTSSSPTNRDDVMSWYWRSPPKGKRKIGRQYLSTDQAFNALCKTLKK